MVVSPSGDGMTHRVWNCPAFLLVVFVCLTLSPSGDRITLPVWWKWLDFAGFARIGRVVLSGEGGFESGGWCRRAFLLFILIGLPLSPSGDRMTLPVQNCPPGTERPSGCGISLPVEWGRLVFLGFAWIGRVELLWEGGFDLGGCYCRAFLLVVFVWLTLSPSRFE